MVIQLFNNKWICRYPLPQKVVFDNGYDFKRDYTPLLNDFGIKPVPTTIKNPQANAMVERGHQVVLNMLSTKDLDNKVLYHIDPWGETLASIAWAISASYHRTIMSTQGQSIFDRDILFNLALVLYCKFVNTETQRQVDIDNVKEMLGKSRMTTQ